LSRTTPTSTVHVLGIRHHGPGSARSLRQALATIKPDAVLIEGPPEADPLLPLAGLKGMAPPVALLAYRPERPRDAVYYPFAEFSPEWQAIRYALGREVAVRFMDLPVTHWLGRDAGDEPSTEPNGEADGEAHGPDEPRGSPPDPSPGANGPEKEALRLRVDPLQVLAEAAGFGDGERWWEHVVEHRRDGADLFEAILEAMAEVRASVPATEDLHERRREAHMRQTIRAAQAEGRSRIAVVCGAWHAPALAPDRWPLARDDAAILKGLPKTKVAATWVPWTHGRLGYESGYGAGVESPGWYHHLWTVSDRVAERWMTRVARLLRDEGLEGSSASAIEAVRLAESLAALRERHLPSLEELNDATRTVFCFGDDTPMQLIRRRLIVGEQLGRVPDETPMVPLRQDLDLLQKRLRLAPDPEQTTRALDLREPTDLERSRLLHRLNLLGVPWGRAQHSSGKGTFKEAWRLEWKPEFAVALIEASLWGPTVLAAATAKASDEAGSCPDLPGLTALLDRAILADVPEAVERIMARLEATAAVSSDVTQLMNALPPLANLLRYGNVRKTDATMVGHAVDGMVARICVGLPGACASLDDDAAAETFDAILKADASIEMIQNDEHRQAWHDALSRLSVSESLHGLISGRSTRILFDARALDAGEAARRMGLAVSTAADPPRVAAWVHGFLSGSGEVLYHDDTLFRLFDGWLAGLPGEVFPQLLPLLRRTFGTFGAPVRRNLGEKARGGSSAPSPARHAAPADFDEARAARALPLVLRALGLEDPR
jgi:hypothetical protein